jgi:hypothetical protein
MAVVNTGLMRTAAGFLGGFKRVLTSLPANTPLGIGKRLTGISALNKADLSVGKADSFASAAHFGTVFAVIRDATVVEALFMCFSAGGLSIVERGLAGASTVPPVRIREVITGV